MYVDTCCGRLFIQIVGQGPDIVLWPSLLTDGGLWHHQLAQLSEHHRVVNIDPPGHGRSDPTTRGYGLDDCVRAATMVLDAVDAHEPAWCGLSWGGMVGMRLAARAPDRLSSLILADTSARTSPFAQRLRYGALGAIARRIGPIAPLVKQTVPVMFAHPSAHPDEVRRYEEHVRSMDRRSIGHVVDAVLLFRRDATDEIRNITAPTLVLIGEEDSALPLAESEHLARSIPGAEFVVLPDAGHLSCLEAPDRFTSEVMRFLAERTSGLRTPGGPLRPPRASGPSRGELQFACRE